MKREPPDITTYYQWTEHPKYWEGQLFPEDELLAMGEGDNHYERFDLDEPELHN